MSHQPLVLISSFSLLALGFIGYVLDMAFGCMNRCDERFIGYGGNKAACLFELYLSGIDFFVLSDDFIIHQSHAYAEQARKQEVHRDSYFYQLFLINSLTYDQRKYNRKTYTEYREETCLRCALSRLYPQS